MLPKQIPKVKKACVFIDYANVKSSVRYLHKYIDLESLYNYLKQYKYISSINIYYGTDTRNDKSYKFINWLRNTGYKVTTKKVKYIKIDIEEIFSNKINTKIFSQLNKRVVKSFLLELKKLKSTRKFFEIPKCNLDVEIALDMFKMLKTYDCYILFSGDSDFSPIIDLAKERKIFIVIVSLKRFLSSELCRKANLLIDLEDLLLNSNLTIKKTRGYTP